MAFVPRRLSVCLLLFTVFSYASITPLFNYAAQEPSHEEMIKEAGRLGTEAEQIRSEAHKRVRAGGARNLIREAEVEAANKFRQAIELWRQAGDYQRLKAAVDELSRLYSVHNDYENVFDCLNREVEFWRGRGDLARQVSALSILGIRQMQFRKDKEAIETFEKVIEMSRSADPPTPHLLNTEANALNDLSSLLKKAGRNEEAELAQARAKELRNLLWARQANDPPEEKRPRAPIGLPDHWFDLPSAPLVAEYHEIEGVKQAVLVNRYTKGIEMVFFGCIKEEDGKIKVIAELVGMGLNHGGVRPGHYYEPFELLNGPMNQWTDKKKACEAGAKMAVIRARFDDRNEWNAEGQNWVSH